MDDKQCRFCFDDLETNENKLIIPCNCIGSIKYIHQLCLIRWILKNTNINYICSLCKSQYNINLLNYIETPIYNIDNIRILFRDGITSYLVFNYLYIFLISFILKSTKRIDHSLFDVFDYTKNNDILLNKIYIFIQLIILGLYNGILYNNFYYVKHKKMYINIIYLHKKYGLLILMIILSNYYVFFKGSLFISGCFNVVVYPYLIHLHNLILKNINDELF